MRNSKVYSHISARDVVKNGSFKLNPKDNIALDSLKQFGVDIVAMDSLLGGGSGGVPGYVSGEPLIARLNGILTAVTPKRSIDELVGVSTVGSWGDEEVQVQMEELAGEPVLYGDNTQIPLADFITTQARRQMVDFELGFQIGIKEDYRLNKDWYNGTESKRRAVTNALDVARNQVGFTGFANRRTYGLLNDPSLPSVLAKSTGSAKVWLDGATTFDNLVTDFILMYNAIETQSGANISTDTKLCFAIPSGYAGVLTKAQSQTGKTFKEWVTENYNVRIAVIPEFRNAIGNEDVVYLFVEEAGIYDESTVENSTVIQAVQERYKVIYSGEGDKGGYKEDAINSTAGVLILRPWAFARKIVSGS